MAPHSRILVGKSHEQRSLEGYSPRGHKEPDSTERPSMRPHTFTLLPQAVSSLRTETTSLVHFFILFNCVFILARRVWVAPLQPSLAAARAAGFLSLRSTGFRHVGFRSGRTGTQVADPGPWSTGSVTVSLGLVASQHVGSSWSWCPLHWQADL